MSQLAGRIYHEPKMQMCTAFQTLLLLLMSIMAVLSLTHVASSLAVVNDNIYPESAGVLAALRWSKGMPLYADYRQAPYLMTPFPPLWYALMAAAATVGPKTLDALTFFGRLVSLSSLFLTVACAFLLNRRIGVSMRLAVMAPAAFLSLPIIYPFAITARPDFPSLLLLVMTIYVLSTRAGTTAALLAGVTAGLAVLMRHNAVAAPIAIVLWYGFSRRWKLAVTFCAAWGIVAGSVIAAFQVSSHGMLALNLSTAKFGPIAVSYTHDILNRILASEEHGFAVMLFAFGVTALFGIRDSDASPVRLLRIYLAISFGLALVGSAAAGAHVNHYFETALAMALLLPTVIRSLEDAWPTESIISVMAMAILVMLLVPTIDVQRARLKMSATADLHRVVPLMRSGQVFTDSPYLSARATSPQALDLASLVNTERSGGWAAWSSGQLAARFRERKFEMVMTSHPVEEITYDAAALYPRWPVLDEAMRSSIAAGYHRCFELDGGDTGHLFIYLPRENDQVSGTSRTNTCSVPSIQGIPGLHAAR